MITPILILSSIFIAIAFIINENNAKYLLSGYNTMSAVEREKFDIKSYIPYFRNFHIFLGLSIFIICMALYYLINPNWCGLFLGTYPLIAYAFFIWNGHRFSTDNSKKQKTIRYSAFLGLLFLASFISHQYILVLADNIIRVKNQMIEITGDYGSFIKTSDIKSITLVEKLPEINKKINGFSLETVKKGIFETEDGEKVKLLINSSKTPLLLITTIDNKKIYYSSKENSNKEILQKLNSSINP